MLRTKPPFRADHVGSLLRPPVLKDARAKWEEGTLELAALKEIEDREVSRIIRKQEEIGLQSITDGELRRKYWSRDFFQYMDNIETFETLGVQRFAGANQKTLAHRPLKRLTSFGNHPMLDHFRFLKANTRRTPKMTVPAPSAFLAHRHKSVLGDELYPNIEDFHRDLGEVYRQAVKSFADAGCRYLQFDEVYMIIIVDEKQRALFKEYGNDVEKLPSVYAAMMNAAVAAAPPDMTISVHLCRGNFKSSFQGTGGYDLIADTLFNQTNVHAYFMEYDTERAGGFEPLRLLPKNKHVVLGVVTSKTGKLEAKDDIKRRIEEATKYVDIDQLCLSPQCGFASTHEGNILTEDEQWRKLELVVEVADEIWGGK